jgi:hypothetical protein
VTRSRRAGVRGARNKGLLAHARAGVRGSPLRDGITRVGGGLKAVTDRMPCSRGGCGPILMPRGVTVCRSAVYGRKKNICKICPCSICRSAETCIIVTFDGVLVGGNVQRCSTACDLLSAGPQRCKLQLSSVFTSSDYSQSCCAIYSSFIPSRWVSDPLTKFFDSASRARRSTAVHCRA